jgi:hypothetical protein
MRNVAKKPGARLPPGCHREAFGGGRRRGLGRRGVARDRATHCLDFPPQRQNRLANRPGQGDEPVRGRGQPRHQARGDQPPDVTADPDHHRDVIELEERSPLGGELKRGAVAVHELHAADERGVDKGGAPGLRPRHLHQPGRDPTDARAAGRPLRQRRAERARQAHARHDPQTALDLRRDHATEEVRPPATSP